MKINRKKYLLVASMVALLMASCKSNRGPNTHTPSNPVLSAMTSTSSVKIFKEKLTREERDQYNVYKKLGKDWGAGQYASGPPEIEYARLLEVVAWYEGYWEGHKSPGF